MTGTPRTPAPSASDAVLAAILSISADAIVTVDHDQHIVDFNRGAEQTFGWAAAEVMGQPLNVLLPPRFRTAHEKYVHDFGLGREAARRMGHRREIFGLRKDGTEFPAEASIARLTLPDGRIVYSAVLRDITDRRRAEEEERFLGNSGAALADSLEYETTLALIPKLAVPFLAEWCTLEARDDDGTLRQFVSAHADDRRAPALAALVQRYPVDEDSPWFSIDVMRHGRLTHVDPVTIDWLEAHTHDADHVRLLQEAGVASVLGVPLVSRDKVIGALTLARGETTTPFNEADVAVARAFADRASMALESARLYRTAQRATRARDVVLGVVSHDLRNPITAIERCARVLRDAAPGTVDDAALVSTIADAARWSQRLIRDLMDVATIEAGRLSLTRQAVQVPALLDRLAAMFARRAAEHRRVLDIAIEGDVAPLYADDERVLQVLANLVDNALKFSEPAATVRVRVTTEPDAVHFTVADSGAGIRADDLPHLFDLYWQARRAGRSEGSGYGLSIARGIVEAHGGAIWAESVVGAGSTFHFTLPNTDTGGGDAIRARSARA